LGANIGLSVRLWLRTFPVDTLVAVEPDAANLALCIENAGAAAGVLKPVQCFVGAAAGSAAIDRRLGTWAYRMAPAGEGSDRIPVRTMPDILADAGLKDTTIDLLKCDIEGAEVELFRG